ncbi:MAG: hypothetical protein EAZ75_09775 [Flavobacteriia bacterium]|nr:MAG: hypothetical protein EAZ75_09775 [Flavobacteriia bacterium]
METNYSESQLQQLVNTEITLRIFQGRGIVPVPIMIDLIEEFGLGWDTAFYFPWLNFPPHDRHRGGNFFIQYKLSDEITRSNGKHYNNWNETYLRFFIPHRANSRHIDYHQYDRLKELANQGYSVYYTTNQVMNFDELKTLASQIRLLDQTPFLNINDINAYHKEVTFTRNSDHFLLHSDIEKSNKMNWKNIYRNENNKFTLRETIDFLSKILINEEETRKSNDNQTSFIYQYNRISNSDEGSIKIIRQAYLVSFYLKLYLDLYWYWIDRK